VSTDASSTEPAAVPAVATKLPKRRRRPVSYLRSGFYAKPELPAPDSPVGLVLAERRNALIADLGGQENCSTAMLAMIDLIVASWAQLDSVTAYLLTLPSLVDRRHRRVWPVVKDRAALATQLQSLLRDIGLDRRAREVSADVLTELAKQAGNRQPAPRPRGTPRKIALSKRVFAPIVFYPPAGFP
jgi:hypothetical protein